MSADGASQYPAEVKVIPPPVEGTWFWHALWWVAWILSLLCARVRAVGRENIPSMGGFVVVCNHTHGFDYVPLGYASPRQMYFMVKAEAFENPILAWIMRNGGGIPVQRGKSDKAAVQRAIDKVADGFPLAIFPEGTRSKDGTLQAAHTGAIRIAMHANASVLPAVVIGAEEITKNFGKFWARVPVTVRFGTPIDVSGDPTDRDQVVRQTERMMLAMAELLPPNKRGIWADGKGKVIVSGGGREQRNQRAKVNTNDVTDGASATTNGATGSFDVQEEHEEQAGRAGKEEVSDVRG